jgi:hypothetical protein
MVASFWLVSDKAVTAVSVKGSGAGTNMQSTLLTKAVIIAVYVSLLLCLYPAIAAIMIVVLTLAALSCSVYYCNPFYTACPTAADGELAKAEVRTARNQARIAETCSINFAHQPATKKKVGTCI